MKKLILMLFIAAQAALTAQKIDTIYFTIEGDHFRKIHTRGDLSGRFVTISEPVDSQQVYQFALEKIRDEATTRANEVILAESGKTSGDIVALDQNVQAVTGFNPADTIANDVFLKKLSGKDLQWTQDGNISPATVTQGNGKGAAYILTIDKTDYTIRLYNENWLHVEDYPKPTLSTDLFLIKGAYRSKEGTYALEDATGGPLKPGGKSVAPAPKQVPPPAVKQTTKKTPAKTKKQ